MRDVRIQQVHDVSQSYSDVRHCLVQNPKRQAVIFHGSLSDHLNTDPVQISLR